MSRSTSRKSRVRMGRIRSAMLAQMQYWKMYAAMKLRRVRVPAPVVVLLFGAMVSFFMLAVLMLSVVAIDVITTVFLLCRKLLGLGRSAPGNAFMPRG